MKRSRFGGAALAVAALAGLTWARRARRAHRTIDFAGRVALITGGSRGLGLVLARELAAEGARLALVARDEAELDVAARELRSAGAEVLTIRCDVCDQAQVERAVDQVIARYGALDVLINNAGVIQVGPLDNITRQDFEAALGVHLWGPLHTTAAAAPHMRRQGGGRIVNIASIGGLVAVPHLLPYAASKHALVGFSDGVRAELAADNILVTTVCPGLMRTGSHFNALFRGHHRLEFAWFAIGDALPFTSIDARRAARQIIAACRVGAPHLTITWQARALAAFDALLPNLSGELLALVSRLLPPPTSPEHNTLRRGWESQSPLAPSPLTHLADQAALRNNEVGALSQKPIASDQESDALRQ